VVIGGGGGTGLDVGRYVRWAPSFTTPHRHPEFGGIETTIGPAHNRLWMTLAQRLGADIESVGETELFSTDGQRIDCTEPLDRL
jgi:hypothetical protein